MNSEGVGRILRRYYKQVLMIAVDFILLSAALLFAFWARLGEVWFPYLVEQYVLLAICLFLTHVNTRKVLSHEWYACIQLLLEYSF